MKPLYTHDCANDTYLGQYEHENEKFDLHYAGHDYPLVIARYGNAEWNYVSGMQSARIMEEKYSDHPLVEALRRARD